MTAEQTLNAARLAELESFQATLDADTPAKREEARRALRQGESRGGLEEAQAFNASFRGKVEEMIPNAIRLAELESFQATLDADTPAERAAARLLHAETTIALEAMEASLATV